MLPQTFDFDKKSAFVLLKLGLFDVLNFQESFLERRDSAVDVFKLRSVGKYLLDFEFFEFSESKIMNPPVVSFRFSFFKVIASDSFSVGELLEGGNVGDVAEVAVMKNDHLMVFGE